MLSAVAKISRDTEPMESATTFDDFWTLYPKRVAKRDAEKAWNRLSEDERMQAVVAVSKWRRIWMARDLQYAPHASTWLNGARWEDELPADAVPRPAAHAPAALPADGMRGTMPDEVKALLAKLRRR